MINSIFSNREIAVGFWIIVVVVISLFNRKIRASFFRVVILTFQWRMVLYYLSFALYLSGLFFIASVFGLWNVDYLKDSILWFLIIALPSGFSVLKGIDRQKLKYMVFDNLKLIAIVEFVFGLKSYGLIFELIQIPIIVFVVAMQVSSEKDENTEIVYKIMSGIIGIYVVVLLILTLIAAIQDIRQFANTENLIGFVNPIAYALVILPYLYFHSLKARYELLLIRVRAGGRSKVLNRKITRTIFCFCGLSSKRIDIALDMNNYNIMLIKSEEDLPEMISKYYYALRSRAKER